MDSGSVKRELRRTVRRILADMPPEARTAADRRIQELLLSMAAYREAETVCCYVSVGTEIDTRPVLDHVLNAGKRLCVPLCRGGGVMEMRQTAGPEELVPGPMGIPEPPLSAPVVPPDEIDLLTVPCLTCDRQGRRLGQGGGYYDRYLSGYGGTALLLCREALVRDGIPFEPWDVPVPFLLTERGLFEDGAPVPVG